MEGLCLGGSAGAALSAPTGDVATRSACATQQAHDRWPQRPRDGGERSDGISDPVILDEHRQRVARGGAFRRRSQQSVHRGSEGLGDGDEHANGWEACTAFEESHVADGDIEALREDLLRPAEGDTMPPNAGPKLSRKLGVSLLHGRSRASARRPC